MPTDVTSGTQTAVINTEHTLTTQTASGSYVVQVDLAAMAAGDTVELRVYGVVLASGTERLAQYAIFGPGEQLEAIVNSDPHPTDVSFKPTLKQTTGTGRAFPWKVFAL